MLEFIKSTHFTGNVPTNLKTKWINDFLYLRKSDNIKLIDFLVFISNKYQEERKLEGEEGCSYCGCKCGSCCCGLCGNGCC